MEAILAEFRENGRDSEYRPEAELFGARLLTARPLCESRRKSKKALPELCVFCKNNGETAQFYSNHILKVSRRRVRMVDADCYWSARCGTVYRAGFRHCPTTRLGIACRMRSAEQLYRDGNFVSTVLEFHQTSEIVAYLVPRHILLSPAGSALVACVK